jgi:hypothetical protein
MADDGGLQGPEEPRGALSARRNSLVTKLQETAAALSQAYRRLTRSKAKQTVLIFWEQGLEEMWEHIENVQLLLDACESIYDDEAKAAGAEARRQAEPQDDADTRPEAFRQLDEAVTLAVRDYYAARHSLEVVDQPALQSDLFIRATRNLSELGAHCDALAVHMRGPEGLVHGV